MTRRHWFGVAGAVVVVLAAGYGLAQWRLDAWYGRNFEAAFRKHITGEVGTGDTLRWPADADITQHPSAMVQGYLLCGTAVLERADGTTRRERYAIGFSPTPFGDGAHDLFTPAVHDTSMAWVCGGAG